MLLLTCKKGNEPNPTPIDPVVTVPELVLEQALTVKDNGLTLKLKVNKVPDSLLEYGFIIGQDSTFKSRIALVIQKRTSLAKGELTQDVSFGLTTDTLYYVRPYVVKTNFSQKAYNIKSFTWRGNRPIQIDSLYPLKGIMGDTLTLRGRQFVDRFVNVRFGDRIADVLTRNDSVMTLIVPNDLKQISSLVTLQSTGRIDTVKGNFVLNTPKIAQFTTTGTFRDTVTISGENFSKFSNGNVVKFGNVAAKVASFSKTKLRVIVPDDIELSRTTLTVAAQLQIASGNNQFVIHKPELTEMPHSGFSASEISLKGKYFHPQLSKNKVTFEGSEATIHGGGTSELKMTIPYAPYPKRTAQVVLKLLDYEVVYPVNLTLLEKWVLVGFGEPFSGYTNSNAFVIDNIPYLIGQPADFMDSKDYLWKFNPTALTWQRQNLPFNREVFAPSITTIGRKAYVYTGGAANNFWQYEPSENRWIKKADYPAQVRSRGTMFAIGDNVYFGMGFYSGFGAFVMPDNTFYKYNSITDSWSKETDYPTEPGNGERYGPSSFVIGDKAYIACGSTNTGMTQFYSYHPATRTWQKLASFPHPRNGTTAFSYGNYGFVATGVPMQDGRDNDCFRYNVTANRWDSLPDRIGPREIGRLKELDRGYSFITGGRAFVGGGNSSTGINNLFMIDLQILLQ